MVEVKAINYENIQVGMEVWVSLNGHPWMGRVVSVHPDEYVKVKLADGGLVNASFVYAFREDVVTRNANEEYKKICKYEDEIQSIKDLMTFACTHVLFGEDVDEAARLAFQLKACSLLGMEKDQLFPAK